MDFHIVYVTIRDKDEARRIGRLVVEQRLAACVNIIDGMNSMYIWQDAFQDDQEAVLIAKTNDTKLDQLIKAIEQVHSYECPCIVTWPIAGGHPPFLSWITGQVTGGSAD